MTMCFPHQNIIFKHLYLQNKSQPIKKSHKVPIMKLDNCSKMQAVCPYVSSVQLQRVTKGSLHFSAV